MAIDSRNLSLEGVSGILSEGNAALQTINASNQSNNLLMSIQRLEDKILFLEGLENNVLSLFPAPNDRESVRAKVVEYNNSNFQSFFGTDLKKTFIDEFNKGAKSMKTEEQKEQNQLAQYLVQQISANLDSDIPQDKIRDRIAKQFNFTISAVVTEGGSRVSTRKEDIISLEEKGPQILIDELTPAMRERLSQILAELRGQKADYLFPNLNNINLSSFQAQKNQLHMKVSSEWLSATEGMTISDIKKKIDKNPKKWEPFVTQANERIIQLLKQQVGGEAKGELEKFLRKMIQPPNQYIFFVGKAGTEIIGLLGEINAVLAIKKLTGKTVSVEWIANHTSEDNKKVSIDVVLKSQLGINVKNTSRNFSQFEGFYNVHFLNRNPKDILDILLQNSGVNDALSDAFQTSYFNTSYQIVSNRPHVVPGNNSHFNSLQAGLLQFREHLITYLYQFAPEMLYMATDDLEKQLLVLNEELDKSIEGVGNILYMVGGVPFFPSEMMNDLLRDLTQIKNELMDGGRVNRESFFFDISKGSSETIIDYLNKQAASGHSVALGSLGNSGKITTIQMTSAWLF